MALVITGLDAYQSRMGIQNEGWSGMSLGDLEWHSQRRLGAGKPEPTVSIVIPAKNEALNLPHVFAELPPGLHEVILVDGRSTDDTVNVARKLRPDITIIGQTRKGKGNALACGLEEASGDFIVMMDADGSTDPADIPRFVSALKEGADFATGSRFIPGGGKQRHHSASSDRELLAW